jgi:hypothetical protein
VMAKGRACPCRAVARSPLHITGQAMVVKRSAQVPSASGSHTRR